MKNRIFADTVFILGITNRRDQYHKQAVELAGQFEGYPLLVTDAVLLEVGNALARSNRREAAQVIDRLLTADDVEVVHLTPQLFERAFSMYKAYQDKSWSLVDCLSFVVMRDMNVSTALTSDRHFEQAGFQALMHDEIK